MPYTHVPHPGDRVEYLRRDRLSNDNKLVTLAMAILGPDFGSFDVAVQDLELAKDLGPSPPLMSGTVITKIYLRMSK